MSTDINLELIGEKKKGERNKFKKKNLNLSLKSEIFFRLYIISF